MSHRRSCARGTFWLLLAAVSQVTLACERTTPASRRDSASAAVSAAASSGTSSGLEENWVKDAGPALLVRGDGVDQAVVLSPGGPDSAGDVLQPFVGALDNVTLLGRGGLRLTATLDEPLPSFDSECAVWTLRDLKGSSPSRAWSVGFISALVTTLPLDSVESLSARDSMALVAEVARLASSVTAPTAPEFQGLRFSAHDIRRFEPAPGVAALVAHLIRRVNQEANPREEQTLLIAERDSGVNAGSYKLAYAERVHALEEKITTPEVFGAVRIHGRPMLIVARDSEVGVSYSLVERTGSGHWRLRWTSAPTRCA